MAYHAYKKFARLGHLVNLQVLALEGFDGLQDANLDFLLNFRQLRFLGLVRCSHLVMRTETLAKLPFSLRKLDLTASGPSWRWRAKKTYLRCLETVFMEQDGFRAFEAARLLAAQAARECLGVEVLDRLDEEARGVYTPIRY